MVQLSRLPDPVGELWAWQRQGACRAADPRLFFYAERERGPARMRREAAALAVCAACPVIDECRRHGLEVREPYGIWGGLTEENREAIYYSDSG